MTVKHPDSRLKRSVRADGRGHWPVGVPRHPLRPGVLAALKALCKSRGFRRVAALIGTDGRTVQRWVAGLHQPSPEYQQRILMAK